MGRSPCCSSTGLNRGSWTASEDKILSDYIKLHGEGKWRQLPLKAGLKRCGKSCRLRWLNYLKPGIKRGNISHDEEDLIIRLHKLLGNRWSLIAGRLPGRTYNERKKYWKTTLAKKLHEGTLSQEEKRTKRKDQECVNESNVVGIKAVRCSRTHFSPHLPPATNVVKIQDPSNRTEVAEAALFALYHENNNGNDESSIGLPVNGYIGGGGPLNLDFTDSFNLNDEMVKGDDMMSGSSSGTDATQSEILEYLTSIGGQWIMS